MKTALVTGSSKGIGKAIAIELAKQEYCVITNDINNSNNLSFVADISCPMAVKALFEFIITEYGKLDVLINNAAIQTNHSFLSMGLDNWNTVLKNNLTGTFLCGQYAARMMKEQGGGKIINISSVHDTYPWKNHSSYCVSKAGIAMLTKCMAAELAEYNIQVNYITLGGVNTALTDEERIEKILPTIPAKRIAQPEEAAKAVSYLVSPEAVFITGTNITMDGGQSLGVWAGKDL